MTDTKRRQAGWPARVGHLLGVELDEVRRGDRLASAAGGMLGVLAVIEISQRALGLAGASMLIASMGASAVLLFAVPHGQLSQPWPVLAGHLASALIGVTCAQLIDNVEVAAAVAVGLAIGAMHALRCIHPPGGATALTAVVGGPAVQALGYSFVWRPVLLNAVTIVVMAVVFNSVFGWRRYPAGLGHAVEEQDEAPTHEEILVALREMGSFVDVTEDDLRRLARLLRAAPADRR